MTGALYGFDYCTVRAPLCLCHSHETTRLSVRQPSIIVSELNFLHLIDFASQFSAHAFKVGFQVLHQS